ncbi:MAG TPA: hypothetical protein VIT92_11225 [Burkholderiaceae bacterium]
MARSSHHAQLPLTLATALLPVVLVPFIGWRLLVRYRRLTRRQPVTPWRSRLLMVLMPLLLLLLAAGTLGDTWAMAGITLGAAGGWLLAGRGLKLTKFENDGGTLYYTPNAVIGVALFALILARLGYRFWQAYQAGSMAALGGQQAGQAMLHSPATVFLFGLILVYYARYAAGVLRWHKTASTQPVAA